MLTDKLMDILDNIQNALGSTSRSNLVYAASANNFRCTNCSGDCYGDCYSSCSGDCEGDCAGNCLSTCDWECSSSEY